MAFDSGTVTLGNPTKKSDFDQLLSNLFSILNDPHTFKGTKTFNSGTVFTFAPTLPAGAIRAAEIDLGIDAGDVDGDVIPLGTAVTNSPTGGTSSTLPNTSFVRAALAEIFNRLRDLSGVQNDAVDERHINWGVGAGEVKAASLPSVVHAVSSANYTVLDTDGYSVINVTTGAADRTITLPTAAANNGRILSIYKVDSAAYKVIIDGEGAETINGTLTWEITEQYGYVVVACTGSVWLTLSSQGTIYESVLTTDFNQVSPASGTWYNTGLTQSVPAGTYILEWQGVIYVSRATDALTTVYGTLAASSGAEDDKKLTHFATEYINRNMGLPACRSIIKKVASLTTFYLNIKTATASMTSIILYASESNAIIRARRIG